MVKQKWGLSGTALKMIALVLMVMDHIHYFFAFTGAVPEWFSMAARLSAPLFLFCTVEGFAHTHDRRRYFLRIWAIAAAMGTVEFFMIYAHALRRGDDFYPANAIFQQFMVLCIVWQGIDWLRQRRFVRGLAALLLPLAWPFMIAGTLNLLPQIKQMPLASTIVAWVITAPLPLWTAITDGGWYYFFGGIVLYVMMPGEDGFAVCRRIRAQTDAPILFLTARTDEPSVLTGLGLGADDYLTKPFRVAELRARVAAHLRRQNRTPSHKILRSGVALDLSAKEASVNGTPLRLTKSEYAICELLALHAGQTFSKEQIYEAVFGFDGTADDTAITQHIKNIRAKLRAAGAGEVLQTIWGVGYQWQSEN